MAKRKVFLKINNYLLGIVTKSHNSNKNHQILPKTP